ncbi:MAG: hypothetical protein U9P70_03185 [Patescibacteria group bacterium]|nr:hypothetical protein [Patescibacteria group bacterium]
MKKNDDVLELNCSQALEIIEEIGEGRVVMHPLSFSALNNHISGCSECAKRLIEATKKQRE